MAKQSLVPQAREALDKFKMEAASDVGATVPIKNKYICTYLISPTPQRRK